MVQEKMKTNEHLLETFGLHDTSGFVFDSTGVCFQEINKASEEQKM